MIKNQELMAHNTMSTSARLQYDYGIHSKEETHNDGKNGMVQHSSSCVGSSSQEPSGNGEKSNLLIQFVAVACGHRLPL